MSGSSFSSKYGPVLYGAYDGDAYRFNDGEAWVYAENKWHMVNNAEIMNHGHELTPEAFADAFGELPDLPSTAFQS
jgi:hypothetical protein